MLIKSMPEGVREDLVSNKRLSTFSMLAALQVIYQPGGQGEKTTLLKALESPLEVSSASDAVQAPATMDSLEEESLGDSCSGAGIQQYS